MISPPFIEKKILNNAPMFFDQRLCIWSLIFQQKQKMPDFDENGGLSILSKLAFLAKLLNFMVSLAPIVSNIIYLPAKHFNNTTYLQYVG